MSQKQNNISLSKLVPSIITLVALCLGLISIRYALDDKFEIAASLIIIAAILDGLDGRIARLLDSVSEFGAQIDSLADLVNFGIAPGLLMYLWVLDHIKYKGLGWGFVLLYVCCSVIRLARFHTQINVSDAIILKNNFIVGLPMPAAAGFTILPLLYSFEILQNININPYFIAIYMLVPSLLMISRIPIFVGKSISISKRFVGPVVVFICLIFAGCILEPWLFIPMLLSATWVLVPVSSVLYYRK